MLRTRVCLQLALLIASISFATGTLAQTPTVRVLGNDTLSFEESGGGVSSGQAAFRSSVSGLDFQFYESQATIDITPAGASEGKPIRLSLSGASPSAHLSPEGQLPGVVNYISSDTRTSRTNLRTWSGLRYRGIYPGIDLVYYGNRGQLEYDFVVAPQHDPKSITLDVSSAQNASITPGGELTITNGATGLRFSRPVIYQWAANGSRELIAGSYVMKSPGRVGFDIAKWDHNRPLIVDPILVWSGFQGIAGDTFYAGTIDSGGNVYLAGVNGSAMALQKVSSDGTTVVYHTVFTSVPAYNAHVEDIRVDSTGAVYIVGYSGPNFPTTAGAFLGSVTAGNHAFVAVVNPAGTAITYATYLAGTTSTQDQANGVAVDSLGKIYVTGFTDSVTFPTTAGVFQTKNTNGSQTAFVAKVDPTKSGAASLVYSTYLSGLTSTTTENAIAVDGTGNAYVAGTVNGADFPVTKGAFSYDGEGLGQGGLYVTKLNPTATALVYSAYFGPGVGNGIAVDGAGLAYVTGAVGQEDFPTTTGAYQVTYPNGFALQLNAAGSTLNYSTFLSGAMQLTTPIGIAIPAGCASPCNTFVVGFTGEDDLSLAAAIQAANASYVTVNGNLQTGNDDFVIELNPTGTAAVLATYIGGSSDESSPGIHFPAIAVTSTNNAYVVGETSSTDFPVTLATNPSRSTYALEIGPAAGVTAVAYPLSLAFPANQPTGVASTPLVVNLRNMGSSAMTITSITPAPAAYTETDTCGTTLAAGGECPISVTFKPTAAASTPGTLTILQGGKSTVVNLTGTGVAQPFLTLNPTSLTFANQSVDFASPFQQVTVGNSATTSLTLNSPPFSISANFAQTNNCPPTLTTNATCTMNIAFLPTENGAFSGDMFVNSNTNGLATPTFVTLSGNGVVGAAALTLSSAGLVFNPQDVGTISFGQSLTVSNTGNVPVTIFGLSITGAFMDYTASGCIFTLNPGGQCNVRVTFAPTAIGARAATVTLADSTTVGSHSFAVTGTGVAQTLTLSIDPPAVTFPNLAVGATSTPAITVQVTNTGDASVLIDRVFTTGDFRLNNTGCVTALRVATTCNISVEFTPTAVGTRAGTVVIEDNATGSPQKVTLSGTGIAAAPAAIPTPDSINFGTQAEGTTSPNPLTVNLDNIGNLPFDASNVTITGPNAADFPITSQGCLSVIVIPGRNCGIGVSFAPTAAGLRNGTLTFTNAAGTQTAALAGTGVAATDTLVLSPATLTYQPQQKGVQSPGQNIWAINTGTAAITIASMVPASTDYLESGCVGFPIQPNTSCEFTVYLTPTVTTTDNSTLKVTSNATGSPQTITLNGAGAAGAAAMEFLPGNLTFNSQVEATASTTQFVELFNNSPSTVTGVPAIAASGTNASFFTISGSNCTATLGAGSECSFNVSFKPGALGASTAAVSITDSAGTQTLALAGYGVAATSGALLEQSLLQFPSETIGFTSPNQSATFQNTGNTPITISSVVPGGADPGDFSVSTGCPTTTPFNALASCNTNVTFTPTAAGLRTATVTITYTGAAGSPAVITLKGSGVLGSQGLAVGPASITFPPTVQTIQSSISPNVVLTNTGTSPVTITSIALGGTNPGDFAISNGCPLSPSTLPQGPLSNTCSVGVSFTPPAAAVGTRTATIKITDSAPGSPTTINLSGTAVAQTKTVLVTPTTLVFGPQVSGTTSAQQSITVTNTGNFNVTFTNVTITTNYALAFQGCTGTLFPTGTCTIEVTFTPTGLTGTKTIAGTVTITDNATGTTQKVTLSGTGITTAADILLSQSTVVFDAQTVATASPVQLVYYYNEGNTTSTISSLVLSGPNLGDFSMTGSSCTASTQVSALSNCTVRLTFTPAAAGARSATLTITDSDPGSPRKIAISGIGITTNVPEVGFNPASLTFAAQAEGTISAVQNINLTNNGLGNLTGLTIGLGGTDPGDFAQTNNCPAILAAGFSCNIAVTFSPIAIGSRTATVTATDNAAGSPQSVPLTGTGKAGALPAVTLTPASLAFPNVALNTLSQKPVTVKNTGAAALNITSVTIAGLETTDFSQTNNCVGVSVAVGLTCTITVSFTPTTFEDQTATVTIADNAANTPQNIPITGNGAEPAVFLLPTTLAFGSVTHGNISAAQTVTVENYGNATLMISSVTASASFVVSANTCGTSLAAGSTCTISVEFKPTATGAVAGTLNISDNAGDSEQIVTLSGTGT